MKFFNTLLPVLGSIALTGCATINNPEGGPQDLTPPTLLSSNPADQQLNVSTNTITLEFDEPVQQNNLNKELLITPNLDNKFQVRTDENQLQLVFDKPLQDSTTYILNFGKGIQDITEKNVAQGIKLAFSTGSYIDSSRVSGTVVKLLTNEPLQDAVVAMYPANDTLSIRKNKPYYQSRTNATGEFSFNNVREGKYRIYALQDQNNNSLYDNEKELIAYKKDPITVTPQEQQVILKVVKIDSKKPILLKREKFADRITGTYSEGIEELVVKSLGAGKDTLGYKMSTDGRTVDLFKTQNLAGGKTLFAAIDSSGNSSLDTVDVVFGQNFPQTVSGARIKVGNNTSGTSYSPGQQVRVELQTPVRITGANPITIVSDSVKQLDLKYPEQVKLDRTGTELIFAVPKLKPRTAPYKIRLDSTQIIPLQGSQLRLPTLEIQVAEATGTGSISGNVNTAYKSFTVQLLNNKNIVVAEVKNKKKYRFNNVIPGDYKLRVLIDENNNGKWDRPDPNFKQEPDKVFFYSQPLNVRANWEMEDVNLDIQE